MKKFGEYWVPDVDAFWFKNLNKTRNHYDHKGGRDPALHLAEALEVVRQAVGAEAMSQAVAIDAGANVGAYARHLAGVFAEVHAFEPAPDTFACLERNVADWGLAERVKVYPNALSSHPEGVKMGAGLFRRSIARAVSGAGDIPAIPIDSLGLAGVLFVKLDVEGYEEKVLNGARGLIEGQRPYVMMEVKERKVSKGAAELAPHEFLVSRGYTMARILGDPATAIDRLYAPGPAA